MSQEAVERVRGAIDIVELVSQYLQLKRSGASYKACCPFHDEKTPSFHVSPARQMYNCFGCGERGGVFDFVMAMERVEFKDALAILAGQAGVVLEAFKPSGQGGTGGESGKADLYSLHDWAASFYVRALSTPEAAGCREYLKSRGFSSEIIREFGVGYAPGGWSALISAAREAGFTNEQLVRGGLALKREGRDGIYDRFRERLTFTIRDALGRPVGFGARTLDGSEPKYLNSPETPLFSKGKLVYGIEKLKGHPRTDPVLVMEGYTDVVMAAQMEVKGAVATLGTALTSQQARLLHRYTNQVVLVYDGDEAGLRGAERGCLELLGGGHVGIRVGVLPPGEDPFDYFSARGAAGLETLLGGTREILDFLLDRTLTQDGPLGLEDRRRAAMTLMEAASRVEEPVTLDLMLSQISERLSIPIHVLREQASRRKGRRSSRSQEKASPAPLQERRGKAKARRQVLEAVLNEPELLARLSEEPEDRLKDLLGGPGGELAMQLISAFRRGVQQSGMLLDSIVDAELRSLAVPLLKEESKFDLGAQLEGALRWLNNRRQKEQARRLAERAMAEPRGDLLEDLHRSYRQLKGRAEEGES